MTSTMNLATRWQKVASVMQPWLARHNAWSVPLLGGFMLGRFVNAVSGQHVIGFVDLFNDIYCIDRPVNVISWFCSVAIIVLPCARLWARWENRKTRTLALLANLVNGHIDPIIASFARTTFAYLSNLTLQISPDIQNGWPLGAVELRLEGLDFSFPKRHKRAYTQFVKDNGDHLKLDQDSTKYALIKNPSACSDADKLTLQVAKTKYSEVRFFGHRIATEPSERGTLIDEVINQGKIGFPSSLCMHAVVVTKDRKVLVTKRSHKTSYSPNTWSVSVEEQLSPDDLRGGTDGALERWARRLLLEELAVEQQDYESSKFRLISVFLEANILNCSVCAILPIDMTSGELDTQLRAKPRADYEFSEWVFMTYEELATELRAMTLWHHPSTGYRILLALTHQFGAARLADIVFKGAHNA